MGEDKRIREGGERVGQLRSIITGHVLTARWFLPEQQKKTEKEEEEEKKGLLCSASLLPSAK